jgi:hypothetical protein
MGAKHAKENNAITFLDALPELIFYRGDRSARSEPIIKILRSLRALRCICPVIRSLA